MKFLVKYFKKISYLLILLSLFSCQQKPAKIVNRNSINYNKSNKFNQEKYQRLAQKQPQNNNSKIKANKFTEKLVIQEGQTLYSIAKNHDITLGDLIEYNNLHEPYHLKTGEVLKIPYPNFHEVKEGESINTIAGIYDVKVEEIAKLNNLKFPYDVYLGDKIKIAKNSNNTNTPTAINQSPPQELAAKNPTIDKTKPSRSNISSNQIEPTHNTSANKNSITKNPHLDADSNHQSSSKNNDFCWPLKGKVIAHFGPQSKGLFNDGINIKAQEGQKVVAAQDGIIAYIGNELKGYGNLVIIKHDQGWITAYAHLKEYSVRRGDKILRGQKIGLAGNSGKVKSPQLYFGLRKGRDAVNPENYLSI